MELITTTLINLLTWFLTPFAHFLVIYWVVSLFRRD